MPEASIPIVRRVYEAVNRRDWDAAFSDAHPDFELKLQRFDPGTHRGRERITKLFEDFVAAFDTVTWEPDEFLEREDVVVALITARARPKGASDDLVMHNGHLWTIRDGAIRSMHGFPDPAKALEAAGLAERATRSPQQP
jgi:ketosteroid isomerase-like protein